MKQIILFLICCLGLMGCESMPKSRTIGNHIKARITYYTRYEDKFGSKVACSSKIRAKEGITVAAHPHFPFWTKIFIPSLKGIIGSGHFVVQDRGTAVTKMKASRGKEYVFDIYLASNNKIMRRFASAMPLDMDVFVESPLTTQFGNIQ